MAVQRFESVVAASTIGTADIDKIPRSFDELPCCNDGTAGRIAPLRIVVHEFSPGRWVATIANLPEITYSGRSCADALDGVAIASLRLIADRIETNGQVPEEICSWFQKLELT